MRELSLDEIKQRTLDMMDHIHTICEKNGIQYYLHYGTLIGAIRHKGFIPWDDDFDIAMKRSDYIKFCKIVENEKHPYYKLCNRKNTENYYYGISRYADTRFKYVSDLTELKETEIGVFIDVYPLDNFGNTIEEATEIKKKILKLDTAYTIYINRRSLQGGFRTIVKTFVHLFYRIKYGNGLNNRIDDLIYEKIREMTKDDDKLIGLIGWEVDVYPFKKEWFSEVIMCDFEDRKYWIPRCYDEILKLIYGDYLTLPPLEERNPTHSYRIFED